MSRNFLDAEVEARVRLGKLPPPLFTAQSKLWPVGVRVYPHQRPARYRLSKHGDPLR